MRLVFMGTPSFAVPALEGLVSAGHEVALVVTQPDRPSGRGRRLKAPPVKDRALDLGLKVFQPERVKRPEAVEAIAAASPDAFVVAAFGQILPKQVLDIPPRGCYNVHASLLPAYRGAAPINWAIIRGEKVTGVTIMLMDEGMDTGDILIKEKEPILADDTAGSLGERLARLGAAMIVRALEDLMMGMLRPVKQDPGEATYAPMLKKETGLIVWTKPAVEIERLVRGLDPWPGAYTAFRGEVLKIWKAAFKEGKGGIAGEVLYVSKDGISVVADEGVVVIKELQPEGGRRMSAADYLAGHRLKTGDRLGE